MFPRVVEDLCKNYKIYPAPIFSKTHLPEPPLKHSYPWQSTCQARTIFGPPPLKISERKNFLLNFKLVNGFSVLGHDRSILLNQDTIGVRAKILISLIVCIVVDSNSDEKRFPQI